MFNEYEKNSIRIFAVNKKVKMKKIYCTICGKYGELKNPKVLYIFEKTVLSIICSKCENQDEKIFNEEELIEILQSLLKNI